MNIGFFGDSYVDAQHWDHRKQLYTTWSKRLIEDMGAPYLNSGVGGSSQFHAIQSWRDEQAKGVKYDVAVFTLTWARRLYQAVNRLQEILSAEAEGVHYIGDYDHYPEVKQAIILYYRHLYTENEKVFNYEQQVRYCLELPAMHPETKFIFIPNYDLAHEMANRYFTKGVLLDFEFETLSLSEPNNPGPINNGKDTRNGHLSDGNHNVMKDLIKNIILNYEQYRDTVYKVDYGIFNKNV